MNQHNGKDKIAKLCNYYAKNIESYASDGVKEAQVRLGLIELPPEFRLPRADG